MNSGVETTECTLAEILDSSLAKLWPKRAQQELLLDLGERKRWGESDRMAALNRAAQWMVHELSLPNRFDIHHNATPRETSASARRFVSDWAKALTGHELTAGVAAWACALAPALGTTAKTLANSASGPLKVSRSDHRWLLTLVRLLKNDGTASFVPFHNRSIVNVGAALEHLASTDLPDAGDAILLLSLMSLWQRRRDTLEVRANRGRRVGRRMAAKPIAAMGGTLIQPAQIAALNVLAQTLPATSGTTLAVMAIEAGLTEAHLAPHPARVSVSTDPGLSSGESCLKSVETAILNSRLLLAGSEAEEFLCRLNSMRAFHQGTAPAQLGDQETSSLHIRASQALQLSAQGVAHSPERFRASAPGVFMLQPMLRRRGLLEGP